MKKIAILSAVNIKHMSLISLYTSFLDKNSIPYDIIYMDKYDEVEEIGAKNVYRYVNQINHNWSRKKKIFRYFRFFFYAKKILKKNKYDFIIVWNDIAICMFGLYLSSAWKNRYCLNVRDYNGEKKKYVYKIFEKAINNSSFTTISSEGFKSFLPPHDYVSLYSYNDSLLAGMEPRKNKREQGKPIRISFVGNVRFFNINQKLIDVFKNDDRFELHYHGTNAETIAEYASSIGAKNVLCSGTFPVDKTKDFLETTDIVNNVFGNSTIGVSTLTSIRLFHAAHLNIPIIVSANTYMEQVTNNYSMGFSVSDFNKELCDNIYHWYQELDFDVLEEGCKKLLAEAENANNNFLKVLDKWILL